MTWKRRPLAQLLHVEKHQTKDTTVRTVVHGLPESLPLLVQAVHTTAYYHHVSCHAVQHCVLLSLALFFSQYNISDVGMHHK